MDDFFGRMPPYLVASVIVFAVSTVVMLVADFAARIQLGADYTITIWSREMIVRYPNLSDVVVVIGVLVTWHLMPRPH